MHHVEARMPGRELEHHLRALLLLRDLLGGHADAGELLELLLVPLQQVAARALGQHDLELLALALLPVEGGLRAHLLDDGRGGEQPGGGAEQRAATDHAFSPYPVLRVVAPTVSAPPRPCNPGRQGLFGNCAERSCKSAPALSPTRPPMQVYFRWVAGWGRGPAPTCNAPFARCQTAPQAITSAGRAGSAASSGKAPSSFGSHSFTPPVMPASLETTRAPAGRSKSISLALPPPI